MGDIPCKDFALETWDLNLPLTVMGCSNVIPFFTDVEDLLTAHPCSSVDSGLGVLVASYQTRADMAFLSQRIQVRRQLSSVEELIFWLGPSPRRTVAVQVPQKIQTH